MKQSASKKPATKKPPNLSTEGVVYDTPLENTLENMEDSNNFINIVENGENERLCKGKLVKMLGGTTV